MMEYKKYLPMGTVVLLKNGIKKIMIFGRKQKHIETGVIYDYIAYIYPEGNIKADCAIFFNHDDIREVVHLGYIDEDEERFCKLFLETGAVASAKDVFHSEE